MVGATSSEVFLRVVFLWFSVAAAGCQWHELSFATSLDVCCSPLFRSLRSLTVNKYSLWIGISLYIYDTYLHCAEVRYRLVSDQTALPVIHTFNPPVECTLTPFLYCPGAEFYRTLVGTHFPSRWEYEAELAWVADYNPRRYIPQTVTHPSTNRSRRRVTSSALLVGQAAVLFLFGCGRRCWLLVCCSVTRYFRARRRRWRVKCHRQEATLRRHTHMCWTPSQLRWVNSMGSSISWLTNGR